MITGRTIAIIAISTFALVNPASATVTVTSGAYGLFSDVKVLNTVGVTVGPVAHVSGTTSPGYDVNGSVASVDSAVDLGVVSLVSAGLNLSTGVITTNATANGTNPNDTSSGSGYSDVDNLGISLFTRQLGITTTTLGLLADTITSQTSVMRIGEINTLVGSSVFSNLNLTVLGVPTLSLGANAQVGANFVAYNQLGLKVTLNEQKAFSNGSSFQSLITNALHISFIDFLLDGRTVTGDVIIGQSRASIDFSPAEPVPEPAIWLQLITGFGLTGMVVRKRRSMQAVVA